MSRFRAVVFDFDGLIVDTETPVLRSWQDVFDDHGVELTIDFWARVIGTAGTDVVGHLRELTGLDLDREDIRARQRAHEEALNAEIGGPLPGVEDRIREAQRLGLRLGVASSSSEAWVTGHLERIGLRDAFAALACAGAEPGRAKPEPVVYREVCAALGVEPQDAVAIEDTPHGITAARSAGLACIAVPNQVTVLLDLSTADLVIDSLAEHTLEELFAQL